MSFGDDQDATTQVTLSQGAATVVATSGTSPGRFYSQREMALVSRVSDLLIPRTATPGALDVNVPGFLDGLMTEWASAETQTAHHATLAFLDDALGERTRGDFVSAEMSAARQALGDLDQEAFSGASGYAGYRDLKGLISQSYFATEAGALQEQHWVAAPGRWDPCAEL